MVNEYYIVRRSATSKSKCEVVGCLSRCIVASSIVSLNIYLVLVAVVLQENPRPPCDAVYYSWIFVKILEPPIRCCYGQQEVPTTATTTNTTAIVHYHSSFPTTAIFKHYSHLFFFSPSSLLILPSSLLLAIASNF